MACVGENYLLSVRIWFVACGNRCVTWYFRLGELLSPERKHQGMHFCSCAKSRLGELGSPERDSESRLSEPAQPEREFIQVVLFASVSVSPRRD